MARKLRLAFVISRLGVIEAQSAPLLAAMAIERGHEAILVDFGRNPRGARRRLRAFGPDIVAYSVCSNEAEDYLEINRVLKGEFGFFSVFGGPHPTFSPEYIEGEGVDAICRGEGDLAFPQFLERFGTEALYETQNFSFKTGGGAIRENPLADLNPDLDRLPFPARRLLYAENAFMARNPIKGFVAGRGCPNSCSYCFNHRFNEMYRGKGRVMRVKSVSYLLREIGEVARAYPLSFIRFYDDIFGADLEWLAEFAQRFPKEVGVPFCCNVRPNMVTEEFADLLKRAGCYSAYSAIECGNERLRNDVLCRYISNDQVAAALGCLKSRGIRIVTLNMIGLPGETEEQMLETLRINQELEVDLVDVNIFQPYPGTRAHQYCREHGYLLRDAPRFENFNTRSILDIDPALKQHIYVLHKIAALLVDHPSLMWLTRFLPRTTLFNGLLNFWFRLYFGYFLHRRIYALSIPFAMQIRGGLNVLFSKSRV